MFGIKRGDFLFFLSDEKKPSSPGGSEAILPRRRKKRSKAAPARERATLDERNSLDALKPAFEKLGEDVAPSQTPVTFTSTASHSSLLSELKKEGFTQSLTKVDPAQLPKPAKPPSQRDYRSMLRQVTQLELERSAPSRQTRYLITSEEYEQAGAELEKKELIPNAAAAYACAALCMYLAVGAKMAVNFLASYAKGAPRIAKEPIFQLVRQILRAVLLKDHHVLAALTGQITNVRFFAREDVDIFEAAIRKALNQV